MVFVEMIGRIAGDFEGGIFGGFLQKALAKSNGVLSGAVTTLHPRNINLEIFMAAQLFVNESWVQVVVYRKQRPPIQGVLPMGLKVAYPNTAFSISKNYLNKFI